MLSPYHYILWYCVSSNCMLPLYTYQLYQWYIYIYIYDVDIMYSGILHVARYCHCYDIKKMMAMLWPKRSPFLGLDVEGHADNLCVMTFQRVDTPQRGNSAKSRWGKSHGKIQNGSPGWFFGSAWENPEKSHAFPRTFVWENPLKKKQKHSKTLDLGTHQFLQRLLSQ